MNVDAVQRAARCLTCRVRLSESDAGVGKDTSASQTANAFDLFLHITSVMTIYTLLFSG